MEAIQEKILWLAQKIELKIALEDFLEAERYQRLLDSLVKFVEVTNTKERSKE